MGRDFTKVCTVHANCCVGLDNKVHDLRILLNDWSKFVNHKASSRPSWSVPQDCRYDLERICVCWRLYTTEIECFFFFLLFVGMGTSELRFKEGDRASMVRKKAADGYNQKLSWNQLYVLGYENLFSSKHLNFNSNV